MKKGEFSSQNKRLCLHQPTKPVSADSRTEWGRQTIPSSLLPAYQILFITQLIELLLEPVGVKST